MPKQHLPHIQRHSRLFLGSRNVVEGMLRSATTPMFLHDRSALSARAVATPKIPIVMPHSTKHRHILIQGVGHYSLPSFGERQVRVIPTWDTWPELKRGGLSSASIGGRSERALDESDHFAVLLESTVSNLADRYSGSATSGIKIADSPTRRSYHFHT